MILENFKANHRTVSAGVVLTVHRCGGEVPRILHQFVFGFPEGYMPSNWAANVRKWRQYAAATSY